MKIALYNLTTTTKSGGIETFNWEMAKVLAKKGHTVYIYGGKGNVSKDNLPPGVVISMFPFLSRRNVPDLGSRFRKFVERLSFGIFSFMPLVKGRYDVIYIHKPYDLPTAILASWASGAKVVFGSHGTEFFPGYKYLVKKADYLFACSNFNAEQVKEYCGIKPDVLPNGIDTELFKPLPADSDIKERLNINNEMVIITACRLVGWKGIQYSIRAFDKLIKKGYNVKYIIIGDGEERTRLESLTEELNMGNRIIFIGNVKNSELPRYYSIAYAAVFPSIANETFGISIAEAMSCGVPVVSTKVGGIPEVVAEGTGFLVPPKDVDAIADKIELLIMNDGLRRDIGIAGRKRVIENFSWDIIAEKFERCIGHA